MIRVSSLQIALLIAGTAVVFMYSNSDSYFSDHTHTALLISKPPIPQHSESTNRHQETSGNENTSTEVTQITVALANTATGTSAIDGNSTARSTISAKKVKQWVMQLSDDDPDTRAAAIDALASAPKSQAFPVLQKVLGNGEDKDRELALDALHTLALREGDDDDDIRTALRLVIYDGDDEIMMSSAQIALDDIEHDLCLGK